MLRDSVLYRAELWPSRLCLVYSSIMSSADKDRKPQVPTFWIHHDSNSPAPPRPPARCRNENYLDQVVPKHSTAARSFQAISIASYRNILRQCQYTHISSVVLWERLTGRARRVRLLATRYHLPGSSVYLQGPRKISGQWFEYDVRVILRVFWFQRGSNWLGTGSHEIDAPQGRLLQLASGTCEKEARLDIFVNILQVSKNFNFAMEQRGVDIFAV